MPAVQNALAEYIAGLETSLRRSDSAEGRLRHQQYLAEAGVLLARTVRGDLPANLLEGLKAHDRVRDQSPLTSGDHADADSAWERLTRIVPAMRGR